MAAKNESSAEIDLDEFESLLETLSADDLEKVNDYVDPEVSVSHQ